MFLNQDKNNLGRWSPVTSIVDWCEPNYQHFDSIAETYNTFSSIAYILVAFWYFYTAEKLYRSHKVASKLRQLRIYVTGVSAMVVGVGTYLFHMTLLRENQMLDEISMNSLILLHIYGMINMSDDVDQKQEDGRMKRLSCFGLFNTTKALITAVCCFTLFSITIFVYDNTIPVVFQTMFGLSILTGIILSGFEAAKKIQNVHPDYQEHFDNARRVKILLLASVIITALLGFGVWLTDNFTCPRFEHFKLHAIWHVFTAYAGYMWGVFSMYCHTTNRLAQLMAAGEPAVVTKVTWGLLPYVSFVKVVEPKSKRQ